jgi:hypothetical protein
VRAQALIAVLWLAACASAPEPPPRQAVEIEAPVNVSGDTVRAIESRIEMPPQAQALAAYDRYYAGMMLDGREGVQGVLLLRSAFGSGARPGMAPVADVPGAFVGAPDDLPRIDDGGCSVVTLYFGIATQSFVELYEKDLSVQRAHAVCNGRG